MLSKFGIRFIYKLFLRFGVKTVMLIFIVLLKILFHYKQTGWKSDKQTYNSKNCFNYKLCEINDKNRTYFGIIYTELT